MEQARQLKVGEKTSIKIRTHTGSRDVEATVLSVSDILSSNGGTGYTTWLDIDGREYEYWFQLSGEVVTNSGLPYNKMARDFNWTEYGGQAVKEQKEICNAFVKNYQRFREEGRGLFIYSETVGSGKTMLACCLANDVTKRYNTRARFISAADYMSACREHDNEVVEYLTCALLILDDIGAQASTTDFQKEALYRLVDNRYRNGLSTIYTSNLPFTDNKIDDRVMSRIYARSIPIKLPEISVRKNHADNKTREFLQRVMRGGAQ